MLKSSSAVRDRIPAPGAAAAAVAAEVTVEEGAEHPVPVAGGAAASLDLEEESWVLLAAAEGRQRIHCVAW